MVASGFSAACAGPAIKPETINSNPILFILFINVSPSFFVTWRKMRNFFRPALFWPLDSHTQRQRLLDFGRSKEASIKFASLSGHNSAPHVALRCQAIAHTESRGDSFPVSGSYLRRPPGM